MNRREKRRIIITAIILWLALLGMIILSIIAPAAAGTTKAEQVDPNCITQPIANPLKDCKK